MVTEFNRSTASMNRLPLIRYKEKQSCEERVQIGESLRFLRELAPDEDKFYPKGAKEVEELIEKTN